MKTLLQINVCLNLSTGKIAQQIGEKAMQYGWESWIVYSGRESFCQSSSKTIKIGNFVDACVHYAGQRLFDNEGLGSIRYTKLLIKQIKQISPDIIHLHNIHDHWLNYPLLFKFLAQANVPVVWTLHDCWAFTGGCMHFNILNCNKWKNGCIGCPDKRTIFLNQAEKNLRLKSSLLSQIKSLTYVSVSDWIGNLIRESSQKDRETITIHNGIDLSKFKPCSTKKKDDSFNILGVASTWSVSKGLDDFIKLRCLLPSEFTITLVGLSESQVKNLPNGIIGMTRTDGVEELAKLYSNADVLVNTTYSDSFPTVNLEALACGTPVITYKTGGSPEAIDESTGVVVEQGNIDTLRDAIVKLRENPLSSADCRKRAELLFDKEKCFEKYIELYNKLLNL